MAFLVIKIYYEQAITKEEALSKHRSALMAGRFVIDLIAHRLVDVTFFNFTLAKSNS